MKKLVSIAVLVALMAFQLPEKPVRIFMIGDSTMANKPTDENPERGWGQFFGNYFTSDVEIKNYAVNGRSTKSFISEGRWDSVLNKLQKGDWVMIQFGHNDSKVEDTNRYAAPQTLYRANLIRFITEARSKGANPVLITPVMRRKFDTSGKFVDQHGEYPSVVKAVAKELKVPMIDLHKSSEELIVKEGVEGSKRFFLHIAPGHFKNYKGKEEDNTHFSEYGATSMASLVCKAIKDQALPLAQYLKPSLFKEKYEFELPKVYAPHFKKDTVNIKQFGAIADGYTLNSVAINQAIEACAKNGGGTVLIPAGAWLTGPIVMKSNINLHLDKGALVIFTKDFNQYPLVLSSFEGVDAARCQSPITAENLENIAITGEGIFNGSGDAWRPMKKSKMTDADWKKLVASGGVLTEDKKSWYNSPKALKGFLDNNIGKLTPGKTLKDFEDIKDFLRPNMIRIASCKNVLIQGVTFENSPAWTTHLMLSEHITLKGLKVKNPWNGTNTDALDLESCKNALVEDCVFDTGDDGICIKSGRDAEGRKRGVATEEVIINNCIVYHAHGGFVVGSEMSGGARNLYVGNCTFIGTDIGLRFKTVRGRGGVVENIYVTNVNMKDIAAEAVLFDMYYMAKDPLVASGERPGTVVAIQPEPVNEGTPVFRHFYFHNIYCNGAEKAIFIRGLPEMKIQDVNIENGVLQATEGVHCEEAENINIKNVTVIADSTNPVIMIQNGVGVCFDNFKYKKDAELLMSIGGDATKNIKFLNSSTTEAKKEVEFRDKTKPAVLSKK